TIDGIETAHMIRIPRIKISLKSPLYLILSLFISEACAIQITYDIPYTFDGRESLDLFIPEDRDGSETKPLPAAVIMHGGGLVSGDRSDTEDLAVWFANNGFVVINVSYSLAPAAKWPDQISDVTQGVWWLKNNAVRYNINPNKILAVGGSAGGYLAAMLGHYLVNTADGKLDSQVHGIISFSGPWDLTGKTNDEGRYYVSSFIDPYTLENIYSASPLYRINKYSPPVLMFHGTEDLLVPFKQSQDVCKFYQLKGVENDYCTIVALEGEGHSISENFLDNGELLKFVTWWIAL
ncbi:hypothetical protein BMR03_15555, partial [Methylococcaceae bacterium HT2]